MPETHLAVFQLAIGKLQHHAAYVVVSEEVVSRELKVVQGAACVEKKGSLRQPVKRRYSPACVT
jgi:hypothetical protein